MKPNGYLIIGTPDFDSAMARGLKIDTGSYMTKLIFLYFLTSH